MFTGPDGIVAIYRRSKKPNDLFWNEWVSRPPAAVLVYALRGTRITPNQVTFLSLLVALLADATLLFCRGHLGLIAAALLVQAAFILDCTDGQLARIRGTSSLVGGYLDFLMDEIKAVALVAAVAGRLAWQQIDAHGHGPGSTLWLVIGLGGVVVASSGISLTTFMRRPEYQQAAGRPGPGPSAGEAAAPRRPRSVLGRVIALCEWVGRAAINYPAWFWLPAFADHIELFLLPYLAAHALYLGRAGLGVLWRLAR